MRMQHPRWPRTHKKLEPALEILQVAHREAGHHQVQLMHPLPFPTVASSKKHVTGTMAMVKTKNAAPSHPTNSATLNATSNIPVSARKHGHINTASLSFGRCKASTEVNRYYTAADLPLPSRCAWRM